MIMQWNNANPIQPQNCKKINHLIKNVWSIKDSSSVKVPQPIRQPHSTSKKVKEIITHLL